MGYGDIFVPFGRLRDNHNGKSDFRSPGREPGCYYR